MHTTISRVSRSRTALWVPFFLAAMLLGQFSSAAHAAAPAGSPSLARDSLVMSLDPVLEQAVARDPETVATVSSTLLPQLERGGAGAKAMADRWLDAASRLATAPRPPCEGTAVFYTVVPQASDQPVSSQAWFGAELLAFLESTSLRIQGTEVRGLPEQPLEGQPLVWEGSATAPGALPIARAMRRTTLIHTLAVGACAGRLLVFSEREGMLETVTWWLLGAGTEHIAVHGKP